MSALRWLVVLYEGPHDTRPRPNLGPRMGEQKRREEERNFDITDDGVLRGVLEAMVKAHKGTLNLPLERWSIVVRRLGGGQIMARCSVRPTGATVVRR